MAFLGVDQAGVFPGDDASGLGGAVEGAVVVILHRHLFEVSGTAGDEAGRFHEVGSGACRHPGLRPAGVAFQHLGFFLAGDHHGVLRQGVHAATVAGVRRLQHAAGGEPCQKFRDGVGRVVGAVAEHPVGPGGKAAAGGVRDDGTGVISLLQRFPGAWELWGVERREGRHATFLHAPVIQVPGGSIVDEVVPHQTMADTAVEADRLHNPPGPGDQQVFAGAQVIEVQHLGVHGFPGRVQQGFAGHVHHAAECAGEHQRARQVRPVPELEVHVHLQAVGHAPLRLQFLVARGLRPPVSGEVLVVRDRGRKQLEAFAWRVLRIGL